MGKKLAFWGDCNGYGYKIIRILEELGGINVSNYGATEVTSLYYIDEKNRIKGIYNGDLDKEKYVVMTYHDFITKYPFQIGDIVYTTDNHEEGEIVEILWDETKEQMRYFVDFENTISWVFVDDIFYYEPKDNSDCGTAIKPMKVKSNAVKLVDDKVVDNSDEGKTMNKKLAIRGHSTRGNEVIEILEMMGGKNKCDSPADNLSLCYLIDDEFDICAHYFGYDDYEDGELNIFTLEEFLEKYPFKVGDKIDYLFYTIPITVKSMSWSEDYCTMVYDFVEVDDVLVAEDLVGCKKVGDTGIKLDKNNENKMKIVLIELLEHIKTTPKEELEREFEEIKEWSNVGPTVEEFRTFCECVNKKPKYPDNYKECAKIMNCPIDGPSGWLFKFDANIKNTYYRKKDILMGKFIRLLICRDAYWQVVGEEIGLGKPWEPYEEDELFIICNSRISGVYKSQGICTDNFILSFPTEEMRDAFYENFKDLIEQCKELL